MAASTGPSDLTKLNHPPVDMSKTVGTWGNWFAGALAACTMLMAAPSEAEAQSRTLKLYHVHNRERVEITYRRGNSYDPAALKKLNMFFRDWRKNQPTKMDPKLFDVLWEVYRRTGAKGEIQVIGGYRSPATNSMLRSRSKGVAKNSQHTMGRAIDFYIPGVPLKTLRNAGLQLQAGGVGYYPSSGSPFVHMDVGNVRHWPRIGESELASIMSKGSKMSSGGTVIAAASPKRSGGFLSAFFGRGAEEEDGESVEETPAPKPAARKPAQPVQTAKPRESLPGIEIIPPDQATPAVRPAPEPEPAPVEVVETPETIIAALPARKVPLPAFAPRPQAEVGSAVAALNQAVEAPKPGNMPFAVKPVEEPMQDVAMAQPAAPVQEVAPEQEVALGIPLPSWRPEHKATQPDVDATALLAMAATEVATDVVEVAMPMPTERPTVAASTQGRVAKPVAGKSNASAVVTASIEPVKTTRKDARPTRVAAKPTPKPVVVAAPPASARWAIDENYVSAKSKAAEGPAHAYNVVRTAPIEVYTAGFQQGGGSEDMNRFTGKAVEFLSVAKFK